MAGFGVQYGVGQYGLGLEGNPPYLYNQIPVPSAIYVALDTSIIFDVLDDTDIDLSTLIVFVNGVPAIVGGLFQPLFFGSLTPITVGSDNGYHVVINHAVLFDSGLTSIHVLTDDVFGNSLDETYFFQTRNKLRTVEMGPYEITLDVEFSAPMLLSTLLDASYYTLSNGAFVRYVEPLPANSLTPTNIRLWVEGFFGKEAFTLTVLSPPVMDATGSPLAPQGVTAQITPFQSSAFFSNTTGLVRSWRESRLMLKDSQRAYLVGIRGLDAFDITNSIGRSVRWSQVLDAYGAVAACLSGESDYTFSDVVPPFLGGRNPAPGATGVSKNTHIYLSVADETTSVEVTQLTIYLRNAGIPTGEKRIFSGANGWECPEVCGGLISVQRQALNIHLIPKQPFNDGPVTVLVTAVDLVGNLLSTSYTFTVGGGPVVLGGFGTEAFGIDPFGT